MWLRPVTQGRPSLIHEERVSKVSFLSVLSAASKTKTNTKTKNGGDIFFLATVNDRIIPVGVFITATPVIG